MSGPLDVLDLMARAKALSGRYENVVVAEMNDHVVRLSMMTEPYFWHLHPNSDETFLNFEGALILEIEDKRVVLAAGQMLTVPKGVAHRSSPVGERSVNITIERADLETVRVAGPFDAVRR